MVSQISNIAFYDSVSIAVIFRGSLSVGRADAEEVPAVAKQTVVSPVGSGRADSHHRNVVYDEHYNCEDGKTQPAVCNDLIDLIRGGKSALIFLLQAAADDGSYVNVALVGDDRLSVVVHLSLGSLDVLFNVISYRLSKSELFNDLFVALKDLDSVPSLLLLGHIVNANFLDMCDSVLYTAAE